jgi:uncharacterized protein YaaW (UPF0174 family)
MRVFPRNFSRSAWVVLTNGLMLFGLLAGSTSVSKRVAIANGVIAAALSAGILLELTGAVAAALVNVVSFLYGPLRWVWERVHDANFEDHPGEYGLTLVLFVIPCLVIVAVNLLFYVPPLLRWRHGERTSPL